MSDPGRNTRIERIRQRRRDYRDAKAREQLAGCASLLTLLAGIFLIAGPFMIGADAGWWTLALTLPASGSSSGSCSSSGQERTHGDDDPPRRRRRRLRLSLEA
jgi:fatty acid desaturase